mmetsp:Transcript_1543/g.3647  ORF Transcript_1543/g.3647 Transcript_1543/m.3647 type:complete len:83 (+) Transcript_1543:646-894(+)
MVAASRLPTREELEAVESTFGVDEERTLAGALSRKLQLTVLDFESIPLSDVAWRKFMAPPPAPFKPGSRAPGRGRGRGGRRV